MIVALAILFTLFGAPPLWAASPYPNSTYTATLDLPNRCSLGFNSDQWPMTWQTNGETYTAYGDGNGMTNGPDVYYGFSSLTGTTPCVGLTVADLYTGPARGDFSTQSTFANKKFSSLVSDGGTILRAFWGEGAGVTLPAFSTDNAATFSIDTDNFNRTNEGPPPTGWITTRNSGWQIVSNHIVPGDTINTNVIAWNTTISANMQAFFDVTTQPESGVIASVVLRGDASANGYYVQCEMVGAGNDAVNIYKRVSGVFTLIQSFSIGTNLTAPFTCGGRVVGDTITAIIENQGSHVQVGSAAGDNVFTAAGFCEISSTASSSITVDNFNCSSTDSTVSNQVDGLLQQATVQFGQGYTGLPSLLDSTQFYYTYIKANATDTGASAAATDVYLCRAPRSTWNDKTTYQCVTAIDGSNTPTWGPFVNRLSVFHDATGFIAYFQMSYNPGIGRFIAADVSGVNQNIVGIFDAPAPWGPWTTLYYSATFVDSSEVVMPHVPTTYTSADGLTMYLVYSGQNFDSMNFVKMTLTPPNSSPPPPTGALLLIIEQQYRSQ